MPGKKIFQCTVLRRLKWEDNIQEKTGRYENMRYSLALKKLMEITVHFFYLGKCNFPFIKIRNRFIDFKINSKVNLKRQ